MADLTATSSRPRSPLTRPGWPRTVALIVAAVAAVLLVRALLAAAAPRLFGHPRSDRRQATLRHMDAVVTALTQYYADNGSFPTDEQGLDALLRRPEVGEPALRWRGPYTQDPALLLDGWGRPFHYIDTPTRPGYRLWSLGADDMEGGVGEDADVLSWERGTLVR